MQKKRHGNMMIKSILSVSGIVILAKLLGFVKQMVTANAFGATIQTDMIALAEGLVANMDYLLVNALSTAFIPTYIHLTQENNDHKEKFVSDTIKLFLVVTLVTSSIFFTAAPIIARLLAPSYNEELSRQLANYIRLFAPVLIAIVELSIFNSLLKGNQKFVPGELIGFNQSVILILLVISFGTEFGPDILVVAFYAYAVFNLIYLMIKAKKYWVIRPSNPFANPHVKKLLGMMVPLLLGYSVVFVNQQVDKIIVSGFEPGTVTAMNYASVLSNFVTTFVGSICGVLFTYITKHIAQGQHKNAAYLTNESIVQIITIFIPISILTIMNAEDIVSLVFGRGRFDSTAVQICALALIGYSFMFIPFIMRELYNRFQYGYGDSKEPMINSTIAIVANILLSITLSRFWGVLGVTLATSISVFLCAILNFRSSRRRNIYISWTTYTIHIPRWLVGICVCMAISQVGQTQLSFTTSYVRFPVIVTISLLVYSLIVMPIIHQLVDKIRMRG